MQRTFQQHLTYQAAPSSRQPYHHPHTCISPVAHLLKQAAVLSPLLIAEFVEDPERRWRYTRITLVLATVLSEVLWTAKIHNERKHRDAHERQEEHSRR